MLLSMGRITHPTPFRGGARPALFAIITLLALLATVAHAQQPEEERPLVPESFALAEAAAAAIEADWLTKEERAEMRVFHGVWDERDLITPAARAAAALNAWQFDDPALSDDAVSVMVRAEALRRQGALREAIDLLGADDSIAAIRIRTEALEGLGDYPRAAAVIAPALAQLQQRRLDDAAALTEGVRILALRARIEGQPSRDYQSMMTLIAQAHQQLDRLYWPAKLVEAELLLDKHNDREAAAALHETLALNPRSTQAWYDLGVIALAKFDFDGTHRAIAAIRRVDAMHPLAELLYAEMRLVQNDPADAQYVLARLTDRLPRFRAAHALMAAAAALLYEQDAFEVALAQYEELSPGGADAHFQSGRFLSMFRQYDDAALMLEEAIRRQPRWPAPQIELGLMEMQSGRDANARHVLNDVIKLDPFNKQAANSQLLLEELAEFAEIETEHFVIRYRPGIDEVVAMMMPGELERIHQVVAARFNWHSERKTIIELMPDHKRFSVRITGMPHIHTIAACTGPIIAMEVPREGKGSEHLGTFDWPRVLQHEYTHTVTLDQTKFRIPHWLTEAAAVSMEPGPRDYEDCVMLSESLREHTLFNLDEIKWAFVRPKRPHDRGKAYTQGHWMVEFMNERFGDDALLDLLARYYEGEREQEAIPNALGVNRDAFFDSFLVWAREQVQAWGLDPQPPLTALMDELRAADPELAMIMKASKQARLDAISSVMVERIGKPARPGDQPFTADDWPPLMRPPVEISDEQLATWRAQYPDHADLLRIQIQRMMDQSSVENDALIPLLVKYAQLRPVDPFPHRRLALIYLDRGDTGKAIAHLEELDVREEKSPIYAQQLAKIYRDHGDAAKALAKITRATMIDPYDADLREQAAAIAVEANNLDDARMHIYALTLIEPDRPQHQKRLERIDALLAKAGG